MAEDYGITSEDAAVDGLYAGRVQLANVPVMASLGELAVGQVLEYDGTAHSFKKFTSAYGNGPYAVVAEAATVTGATRVVAVVNGEVALEALGATAQADADIFAALLSSGIVVKTVA